MGGWGGGRRMIFVFCVTKIQIFSSSFLLLMLLFFFILFLLFLLFFFLLLYRLFSPSSSSTPFFSLFSSSSHFSFLSLQAAYLVGVSDPNSHAGHQGLVDPIQFAKANQAIQMACQNLVDPDSSPSQVPSHRHRASDAGLSPLVLNRCSSAL